MAAASTVDLIKAVESKTRVPGRTGFDSSMKASVADDLRQAAFGGELDQCHSMISDRGCDVNDRADGKGKWKSGVTALHVAAGNGHVGIIGLLLEFRADTSIKNKDAELPLHVAARAGQTGAVLQLLEAERAKPMHIRKSELKHERPRVRTRDLVNKGRFRLPPTFALSSETLRAAVSSTKSAISMAHEKDTKKDKTALTEAKFTIAGSQFVEFDVGNFGLRHSRINDQKLVEADPPFGGDKLRNAEECRGCLVMLTRGGHVRVIDKVMLAQNAGAIAVVLVNDSNKDFEPKTNSSLAADVKIPVVGVNEGDGKVIRHCIHRDSDALVDLSFSVVPTRDDEDDEGEVHLGAVHHSSSMPHLPSVIIDRSSLLERPLDHLKKTLPVESEVVRKLIRSDNTRKSVFTEAMERCLEILAGATRASMDGAASRVRSITPIELTEVREAIAAEEHALSVSMNMSIDGSNSNGRMSVSANMSGSWTDSQEDIELLVQRKALTSEVERFLLSLDDSIFVNSPAWNRAYAETISGSMVQIHAPFNAGSKVAMELITDLLNSLEVLRTQLISRGNQIRATEEQENEAEEAASGHGVQPRGRSAFSLAADTPKGDPGTPHTPETPAMTRALLQEMGSYNKNRIKKDPVAKEHLNDALDLLESGMESSASEHMEQACKRDPSTTGKRLARVREQLEESLAEASRASLGLGPNEPVGEMSRRWSITSADVIDEPSFVLEPGQAGISRHDALVYACPLLASVNLVGDTALHMAARYGHHEITELLLAFGHDPEPRNKWELTPLTEAVRAGFRGVVGALLQYGAEATAQNGDGENALHIAAASRDNAIGTQLMQMLLAATRPEDLAHAARMPNRDGYTPLHIAKAHGGVEMLRILMESLGPAEFFKTKAEFRFAPKVASGDGFFLQKGGLKVSKQINSRRVWEAELSSLQKLKESPRRRREEQHQIDAAILLQALCRREPHKMTIDALQKAAKLKSLEADMPGMESGDEEDDGKAAKEAAGEGKTDTFAEPVPEVETIAAPPVGARKTRAERASMRKKLEAFQAAEAAKRLAAGDKSAPQRVGRPNPGLLLQMNDQPAQDYPRQPSSMKREGSKKRREKPNITIRT